jgi:hypothetical protein
VEETRFGSDVRRPKSHAFTFVRSDEEVGAEHWHCLECGRQILLWWPPDYRRKVLVPGDEEMPHVATKGGLRLSPVRVAEGPCELPN